MDHLSLQEELQSVIMQSITLAPQTTLNNLNIYKKHFGADNFYTQASLAFSQQGPLVSLICINCPDNDIDEFLSRQLYANLEVVRTTPDDTFEDIIRYISIAESKYLCFCEPNHRYHSSKIFDMVYFLEQLPSIDILIAARNFIGSDGTVVASSELLFSEEQKDTVIDGTLLLQYSISEHKNLFGNLSTLMVTTMHAQAICEKIFYSMPEPDLNAINSLSLLFHLFLNARIRIMNTALISTLLQPYADDTLLRKAYEEFAVSFSEKYSLVISPDWKRKASPQSLPPLPEITFFYTDMGEYYNLEPIAEEAARRGYQTIFTQDIKQKAEIGIYCQHICYPENAKFSVILLHDMAQGHNRWPNIWKGEQWNHFDIGILPGKLWASLWLQCGCQPYANPRYGVYEFGYPKSDLTDSSALKKRASELRTQLNLKYDFSILYAPSWEYDEKEDDFVRALASMKVNLLIKQAHWPEEYGYIIHNIEQMRAMHENKYDNVYYIDPKESIMTALKLCDMVVSDESSVMVEALMFHKPSIAVTDWLIPDTKPARRAVMPIDCFIKCKKVELREYAEKLVSDPSYYHSVLEKGGQFFSNQGSVCTDILDAIEYFAFGKKHALGQGDTTGKTGCNFFSKKLTSKYATCSLWN